MSKRHHPKEEARHRDSDEAPRSHGRGAGRPSRVTSRREALLAVESIAGEYRAEASGRVSQLQSFGPSASMASMSMLCSEFTPTVAPTTDTSVSAAPIADPDPSMRDREHCGNCGESREEPFLIEWWKREHFVENPKCLAAYRNGTCQMERTDAQIEAEDAADEAFRRQFIWVGPKNTKSPVQTHAPQTPNTSAWSRGASQSSTQPQTANHTYSNLQSNNPSTFYNSYMLASPIPSYHSNTASVSYIAPPGRILTGLSPPGYTPATGYPLSPAHYTSSNILYNTQQQATYQPATNSPHQGEQYAPATSSAQQGSSHYGSSGNGHGHGSSSRDKHSKK
ncbi:hypothetical protein BPAE_0058g00270 [Botrytis paeoniae]|uniref:Uncharacterized protein n=1 Tax=Botrytis paeoniae TaxID=278948 RepID=A0A4Z1FPT9_9HELO|nr:hypothetical protein BPAE_0058g00270 [Botrytis paeoniae]